MGGVSVLRMIINIIMDRSQEPKIHMTAPIAGSTVDRGANLDQFRDER